MLAQSAPNGLIRRNLPKALCILRGQIRRKGSTVFSGIQPTGVAHLGNYLGALRAWGQVSASTPARFDTALFSVMDMHALTVPPPPDKLREYKRTAAALIIASGVDPENCIVYVQSEVPGHAELCWILSCFSDFGYLNRMTQWKSKMNLNASSSVMDDAVQNLRLGLFAYPVLQAADILLYKATHVPVGEDQVQHLEFSRHIGKRFNSAYDTNLFPLPKVLLTPTPRVMSLRDPAKKMSKSDPAEHSRIMINDPPDLIRSKIKRAITDGDKSVTYDPANRAGVANLIDMVAGLQGRTPEDVEKDVKHFGGHAELKDFVADVISTELQPVRERFESLSSDPEYLDRLLRRGAQRAADIAHATLKDVKRTVGIY
ncbi:hypothetical protein V1525DRAFT_457357 [Lipomyces kononenkoae]|uniref:Uncharacterized protein n=1 Tax=Lipomyces kononenkoae TaxID=34357 RepID=A0ACC3SYI3_LIPKO